MLIAHQAAQRLLTAQQFLTLARKRFSARRNIALRSRAHRVGLLLRLCKQLLRLRFCGLDPSICLAAMLNGYAHGIYLLQYAAHFLAQRGLLSPAILVRILRLLRAALLGRIQLRLKLAILFAQLIHRFAHLAEQLHQLRAPELFQFLIRHFFTLPARSFAQFKLHNSPTLQQRWVRFPFFPISPAKRRRWQPREENRPS